MPGFFFFHWIDPLAVAQATSAFHSVEGKAMLGKLLMLGAAVSAFSAAAAWPSRRK